MNLEGSTRIAAPRERVFQLLVDPARIAAILPGCEKLEPAGPDTFQVKLKLGLASLSGAYQGTVKVSEQHPPEHLRLSLSSRGPWGFANGDGTLTLEEADGQTEVSYIGEVQVGGMIASIGQRLLEGAARMVVNQFFQNLAQQAAS